MNENMNEQFANASRQMADTVAEMGRLGLENAETVFGLHMSAFQDSANATFAFFGEVSEARDMDSMKAVLPKGAQVVRESIERNVATGQEIFGRTLKTNEAIAQIAKVQVESASAKAQAEAEKAVKATTKTRK